jgi:hypothetical protein
MCHDARQTGGGNGCLAWKSANWYLPCVRFLSMLLLLLVPACGPPCDNANRCAVSGHPPDVRVCDGEEYRQCGDGNRGQVVSCVSSPKEAICTPGGWTFENASLPDGGR